MVSVYVDRYNITIFSIPVNETYNRLFSLPVRPSPNVTKILLDFFSSSLSQQVNTSVPSTNQHRNEIHLPWVEFHTTFLILLFLFLLLVLYLSVKYYYFILEKKWVILSYWIPFWNISRISILSRLHYIFSFEGIFFIQKKQNSIIVC